jgi:hypothetical protein
MDCSLGLHWYGGWRVVVPMDSIEHFTPMYGRLFGSFNPKSNFVTPDLDDDYGNIVVDHDTLVLFTT